MPPSDGMPKSVVAGAGMFFAGDGFSGGMVTPRDDGAGHLADLHTQAPGHMFGLSAWACLLWETGGPGPSVGPGVHDDALVFGCPVSPRRAGGSIGWVVTHHSLPYPLLVSGLKVFNSNSLTAR